MDKKRETTMISEDEMERIINEIANQVNDEEIATAIYNGGGDIFRHITLGICYFAVKKMVAEGVIDAQLSKEIIEALALYGFNDATPVSAEEGIEYYHKYNNDII